MPKVSPQENLRLQATDPPPGVRGGLPPVPGAARAGRSPVPAISAPRPSQPVPPLPGTERAAARGPASWEPASRPSRRSGPDPAAARPHRPRRAAGRRAPEEAPPEPRAETEAGQRAPPPHHRVVVVLAAVIGVVVLYHLGLYFYVDQKIDRVDALATDGAEVLAPSLQMGSETYLVVGTRVPGQDDAASVAPLLASVSADGNHAVLVSVPPTALVDTPMCRTSSGDLRNPTTEAFASSLLDGGPACMVRAVQQLSGLRVDHYLGVDLARLPGMVDALGGVPVCVVPTAATQAAAEPLPAGSSEVSGDAASGFLQPGASGSDVTGAGVAERAQRLLTSTLRAAMAPATLANTVTLTRFLSRAADALTVDEQTTLGDLRVLAGSLGDLTGDAVQRAALPVAQVGYVPAGTDQAYVLLDGDATRTLFDRVIRATQVPDELRTVENPPPPTPTSAEAAPEAPAAAPAPPSGALTVPPDQITVDVLNGTGTKRAGRHRGRADAGPGLHRRERRQRAGRGQPDDRPVRPGPCSTPARTVAAAVPGPCCRPATRSATRCSWCSARATRASCRSRSAPRSRHPDGGRHRRPSGAVGRRRRSPADGPAAGSRRSCELGTGPQPKRPEM